MIAIALLAAAPLACGAVSRPGIAELGDDGVWRGSAVEACRSVAAASGAAGIVFRGYDSLAALRSAADDRIAFVSAAELALAPLVTGPAIATERQLLVVRSPSRARAADDLTGRLVCFIIGTRAEDALTALPVERLGFQEPDEMADGFAAGRCAAIAVDAADALGSDHRALEPPLSSTSILAATPAADPAWTRQVARILTDRR